METNPSRTIERRASVRSGPAGEKPGQMAQAFKRAVLDHDYSAQRAYELYEQRCRQDGRALEDWLHADDPDHMGHLPLCRSSPHF
jgi:hypothetical protein